MAAALSFPFTTRCGYYLLDSSSSATTKVVVLHGGGRVFFPGESPLYLLGKYAQFKERVESYRHSALCGFRALGSASLLSLVSKEVLETVPERVELGGAAGSCYLKIDSSGHSLRIDSEQTGHWCSLDYATGTLTGAFADHTWLLIAPERGDIGIPREIAPAFLEKCQLGDLLETAHRSSHFAKGYGVSLSVGSIVKVVEMLFAKWREAQLLLDSGGTFVLRDYKGIDCFTNTLSVEKKHPADKKGEEYYELDFHCTRRKRKKDPLVGEGGDSRVYYSIRIRAEKPVVYALVACHRTSEMVRRIVSIYKKYKDAPIARIYTWYPPLEKTDASSVIHVLESLYSMDLAKYIRTKGTLTVEESLSALIDVLTVIAAMHKDHMAHRDIKLANLLSAGIVEGRLRIRVTDLVRAIYFDDYEELGYVASTDAIIEPEFIPVIWGHGFAPHHPSYKTRNIEKADMWALGLVFYEMLTGRYPFTFSSDSARLFANILREVTEEEYVRKKLTRISPLPVLPESVIRLLEGLLEKDPEKRMNAEAALDLATGIFGSLAAASAAASGGGSSTP